MRILFIACISALTTIGISEDPCEEICPRNLAPACGYDETCNFNGPNSCVMDHEICRRKQLNMAPFKLISPGWCPKDKPSCPFTRL